MSEILTQEEINQLLVAINPEPMDPDSLAIKIGDGFVNIENLKNLSQYLTD